VPDLMKDEMRKVFAAEAADERGPSLQARVRRTLSTARRKARSFAGRSERRKAENAIRYMSDMARASGAPPFEERCLVGTFHKTGTMLMLRILGDFARHAETGFWNMGGGPAPAGDWHIGFDWWSDFRDHGVDPGQHPTALLIRDPRDVIVSSMKFHRRSGEPWLHVSREALGGRTYQEASRACASDEERYHFELDHQAGATIRDMLAARRDPSHRDTLFLPVEDLMSDASMHGYRRLLDHLGVNPAYRPLALAIAFRSSVFNPAFVRTRHVTSGKSGVWRSSLPASVLEALEDRFPNAAQELGYPA